MTTPKDDFTYTDLSGKRRPRRFVVAGAILLAVSLLIALVSLGMMYARDARFNARMTELAGVMPTLDVPTPTASPVPTETPVPTPTPDLCASDTSRWSLEAVDKYGYLRRIRPECAYEGLKKAIAFTILVQNGWTFREAMDALDYHWDLPYPFAAYVIAPTYALESLPAHMNRATHPDLRAWDFDPRALEDTSRFVLLGCYANPRAYILPNVGERPYAFGCSVAQFLPARFSYAGELVTEDGRVLRNYGENSIPGDRALPQGAPREGMYYLTHVYVYDGDGRWLWLGFQWRTADNNQYPMAIAFDSPDSYRATLDLFAEREPALPVFDAAWVQEAYGLAPKPIDLKAILANPPADGDEIDRIHTEYFRGQVDILPTPSPAP